MARTHPHIDTPTTEDLVRVSAGRAQPIVDAYLAMHALVLEALPDAVHAVDEVDASIGYGARQYGYNGWGLGALTPFTKWASLTLMRGADLDDPTGLLSGTAAMRHVKVATAADVEAAREAIVALVRQASHLND